MPNITVATLIIHHADEMTKEGKLEVANWLREQANDLMILGHEYGDHVSANLAVQPIVNGKKWFK